MEIRLYEKDLTLAAITDRATAVTATEAFSSFGECTLTVPASEADKFQRERILTLPGIGDGYIVQSVKADAASGTATVHGVGVLSYFGRCLLPSDVVYGGAVEPLLLDLAEAAGARVLAAPLSTLEFGLAETVNAALADRTVLSAMTSAANAAGVGMRLSVRDGEFMYNVRPKTAGDITLSRERGRLIGGTRLWDMREYANRILVRGGDGTQVTVDAAGLFDDGVNDAAQPLREIARYASDIVPDRYDLWEDYLAALRAEGLRVLAARRPVDKVSLAVPSATAADLRVGCLYEVEDVQLGVHGRALCTKKSLRDTVWQCELKLQ